MADDEERTPIDDLVDLFVYAPVGLLYEYEDVLPKLVKRGKSQVQLARVLGTMAVRGQGQVPATMVAEAVTSMLVNRITEIGASLGLAPPVDDGDEPSSSTKAAKAAPADESTDDESIDDKADAPEPAKTADDASKNEARPLPIASYDTLTAREIIGLLDELDEGQLARIRSHEEANRARKTVLGKLDRLGA
ncbi:MAG: hypothetical protein AAFO29_25215 [Actinomycetota bacterium]